MKIACVSHGDSLRAGAEICFLEMITGLAHHGHDVYAILPRDGEIAQELRKHGLPFFICPFSWWVSTRTSWPMRLKRILRDLPFGFFRLAKLLKQILPDLVITNTLTIGASALASGWCGIPHVWYVHEFGREDHDFQFDLGIRFTHFLMNRLSRRIVVNSVAVATALQTQIPAQKLRVVPYAVEIPKGNPVLRAKSDNVFRLILVGRMTPSKGHEEAIRAVSILAGHGLSVHLLILGTGDPKYFASLQCMARSLGLTNNIHFGGFDHDPSTHILNSDVALLCSRMEAFGRVTVEAMKLGKPVIGTNSGGTAELIRMGFNGLLYKPGDAQDLARQIERLYGDRDLLNELGRNASNWANETFTTAKHTGALVSVLDEAIAWNRVHPKLNEVISGN